MPSNRKTAEIKTKKEKKKMKHLMPGKEKVKKKLKHAMSEEDQQAHEPRMKKQKMEKKEEQDQDLSPEEKRILERKLKKERKKEEKRLMREAGVIAKKEVPKKPSGLELALNYLTSWSENPKEWKFQKTRQTWLLTHMYDKEKVPDKYFSILLRYLEGLQGNARDTTVQKAEALMKEYDKSETEDSALLETCERLRKVLQLLS